MGAEMAMAHDSTTAEAREEELLSRAAWHYYHDGLTQAEIAGRLGLSRIKVSRLLDKGRRLGLISVQINSRYQACFSLEAELVTRFRLQHAVVVPELEQGVANERLAQATAHYLVRHLRNGDLLASGWGDTVTRSLQRLSQALGDRTISVVSLTGGVASYLEGWGHMHVRQGALAGIQLHLIPAPILASNPEMAHALREEPQLKAILAMAETANYALVGIGPTSEGATLAIQGFVSPAELLVFHRRGAVGDILGQFFDEKGRLLDLEIHQRIVGMRLEDLRKLPVVVGAAGGLHKVDAILGALAGGYLNVLITDEPTARALLSRGA